MDLAVGTVVERYTVEAELGRGGMAVVYRVRHNQLGSQHAMKVLSAPSGSIQKRLLQEGRVQSSLVHPNVVSVTDVVTLEGMPALVMEYVRGPSLSDFLRARRPTTAQIDELARGILAGVEAAHRHGLVHRDLKPGNVLLSLASGAPVPKITDFGLVKLLGGDDASPVMTRSGVVMGTPAYMAPEQIRDSREVDHRADLWSAGAILYELVSGQRAFAGDDTLELFQAICSGACAPVRGEPRMVAAIEAALTVDRDERVADCASLLALWRGDGGAAEVWADLTIGGEDTLAPQAAPPSMPELTAEVDMVEVLPTAASRELLEVRGASLEIATIEPMTFAMGEGRVVTLSRDMEMASAPVSEALLQAFEQRPAPSFDDAVAFCNALSLELGLEPAYRLGEWQPRKRWTIDDIGRMLYDLVKFDRVGPILAHFGEELPRVMQFEPERLGEVDGIGKRTAERIARGWDPTRYWTRPIERVAGASGWRLPSEAELAGTIRGAQAIWEWCWDHDPAPASMPDPEPLEPGEFEDPQGAPDGPRRVVRRGPERGCRPPAERAEDLGFRVVRDA